MPTPQQVADHLHRFLPAWEDITQEPWILETVQGYRLELERLPDRDISPITAVPRDKVKAKEMDMKIVALEAKSTIVQVQAWDDQILSIMFLVPKPAGYRPVFNVNLLNENMRKFHFKMEGLHTVCKLLRPGDLMCTVDLKDACFAISITPADRRFLWFQWRGSTWEFTCLPFGLT